MASPPRLLLAALLATAACTHPTTAVRDEDPADPQAATPDPGPVCEPTAEPSADELQAALSELEGMSASELIEQHRVTLREGLPFTPTEADNLDLIQDSVLALQDDELARLEHHGFAIGRNYAFPTFLEGYKTIFALDLPVYVSADAILFALHRSYDDILMALESTVLNHELGAMILRLRDGLPSADMPAQTAADLDLYLAVAASLAEAEGDEEVAAPMAGASAAEIADLVAKAQSASGSSDVTIFGSTRLVDFSQFAPRGHYAGDPSLELYFRTVMWLGRIDFRLLAPDEYGELSLDRRQLEAALGLASLFDETATAHHARIDRTIAGFVGEPDMMSLDDVQRLRNDLGTTALADLAGIDDASLEKALLEGDYGLQRIASHILVAGDDASAPLPRSFAPLPQRYVVDSFVLSNVVYDRVPPTADGTKRYMPDPLDVAFGALANDHAVSLIASDLEVHEHASHLAASRVLTDAHGCDYWKGSLYGSWLSSLRALSPAAGASPALPPVAETEPWARRILNTQLASWAELRHDTVLYAKSSYSSGEACEFPDAYVDPYPDFYAAVRGYAERGLAIVGGLGVDHYDRYFTRLAEIATELETIAIHQQQGTPLSDEQLAFVNEMIQPGGICGGPDVSGWYLELFYDANAAVKFDPTIVDVHTQPFDDEGEVGKVLHVATGYARPMVVTVAGCDGPRALVGAVSSYFERTTSGYDRLTDEQWSTELTEQGEPPAPTWLAGIVGEP